MRNNPLWDLLLVFVPLSLFSFGGGGSILAPMHHQVVEVHAWLTQAEFVSLFAISRATPGPGSMIVALIGWKVAGWAGALVAALAMFLPSSLLYYGAAHIWNRYRGTRVHAVLEAGLAPVGAGLVIAGAIAILRASDAGFLGWALALASAAVLLYRPVHPLILLAVGGAIFVAAA